jgi:hypothetical protein
MPEYKINSVIVIMIMMFIIKNKLIGMTFNDKKWEKYNPYIYNKYI